MDPTGLTALVAGGVVVALVGAVIAAVTLRRATDVTVGGRPTLLFRVLYSELAALTDGRDGARRTAAFALAAAVGGLLLTAVLGFLARPLEGLIDEPLAARLVAWHDDAAADAARTASSRSATPWSSPGSWSSRPSSSRSLWPRLHWLPGALLAAAATAAWAGTELVAVVVPGDWPAFPPAALVAVYGAVLLLLQVGLRIRRRRGLPVTLGVVAWLALRRPDLGGGLRRGLRWLRSCRPRRPDGAVLGAFLLLAVAIAAVRHSGLAAAGSSGRVTDR